MGLRRSSSQSNKRHSYYGPYPSAWAVKESITLLQKVFRLRTCEDSVFTNRTRPCLLYQIKRCSGPCVDLIDSEAYARDVADAEAFLRGETQAVLAALEQRMMAHAERLEFEARFAEDHVASSAAQVLTELTEASVRPFSQALDRRARDTGARRAGRR